MSSERGTEGDGYDGDGGGDSRGKIEGRKRESDAGDRKTGL